MKIAILSNGTANYSTKRLKEVALARGHEASLLQGDAFIQQAGIGGAQPWRAS